MKLLRILLLFGLPAVCFAQQQFTSLKTPDFEMFTTKDAGSATRDLASLEAIRSFFINTNSIGPIRHDLSIQVIAFRTKDEYAPYSFRSEGGGYFARTYKRDYIVVSDVGANNRALLAHEFTHFVITESGLKLPVWLNEGMAELYSTVEVGEGQAIIGRPPAAYLEITRRHQWIPWETLFATGRDSALYNEGQNMATLYAQSWLLTHMLALSETYSSRFQQFLTAVSNGQSTPEALQSVYHKALPDMDADLSEYVRRRMLPLATLTCAPPAPMSTPALAQAGDFELRFALADLLSSKPGTLSTAEAKLTALSAGYPERPEPEEELGILAIQQNKREDARRHFASAIKRHTTTAEIFYQYSVLEQDAGAPNAAVSALLKKSLELNPNLENARLQLGLMDFADADFESALALLSSLNAKALNAEYEVYFTLSQCYLNLEQDTEARNYAQKAKQVAKTQDEREKVTDLFDRIAQDEGTQPSSEPAPMAPALTQSRVANVQGRVRELICSGGQRSLSIESGGHNLIFNIDDPHLVVRHPSPGYAKWHCGPLNSEPLTIVYIPSPLATASNAKAVELVF